MIDTRTEKVKPSVGEGQQRTHILIPKTAERALCGYRQSQGIAGVDPFPTRKVCEKCAQFYLAKFGKSWEDNILEKGI